jgi:hypothetical protein
MAISHSTYNGSAYGCSNNADRTKMVVDRGSGDLHHYLHVYANRVGAILEVSTRMRMIQHAADDISKMGQDLGPTDRDLLSSQHQHLDQVQPTDNPYHWETPADEPNNIMAWVKSSWVRSNEIARRQADTLQRNTAVRWSRKEHTLPKVDNALDVVSTMSASTTKGNVSDCDQVLPTFKKHRSFSFEDKEWRANLSITLQETENRIEPQPSSMTSVDSGEDKFSGGRSTRFHGEPGERFCVARTFSEILGSEPFIPTALR